MVLFEGTARAMVPKILASKKLFSGKEKNEPHPGQMVQLDGTSSCTPKCYRFDFQSGNIPRLQVRFPVWAHRGGNQLMFLCHTNVSLSQKKKINKPEGTQVRIF